VRCHAWNTVSRSGVGSTVDPKIDTLNDRLLRLSQGGSLVPEGTVVGPEGRHAGGLCDSGLEADSRQTVRARRSVHSGSQLGNCGPVALSWKRAELGPGGLARAVDRSRPRPCLEATSATTDQVVLEARGLLQLTGYPKIPRG
jgi:hypothetical protein